MTDETEMPALHASIRTDLIALLRQRGPDTVATLPVPACPAWTVHDVLAHLAGVEDDILAGRLDGVATDPWTDAQVQARHDRSLAEILDEWEEKGPRVEAMAGAFGQAAVQWTMDCITHDADVRSALDEPVLFDRPHIERCVEFAAGGYLLHGLEAGVPLARLVGGGHEFPPTDAGITEVEAATADTSLFEVLRGITGRRNPDQLRAWSWSTDPEPYLAGFTWGPFTVRADPLVERTA
jgi:uncharacterized protein (TIGR03083 family)